MQLPSQSLFGDYADWPGRDVLDSGGQRLGGVREIYLDRETGRPEWVLVDVDGGETRFVPLADAAVESGTIRVAHPATVVHDAPGIGSEPRIDQSEERRLYAHYGLGYSEDESGSGLPADEPATLQHEAPATPPPAAWGMPEATGAAAAATPGTTDPTAPDTTDPEAPRPAWGAPEATESPASSWSAVAPADTNVSPAAAEPPSPAELESAHIPEPPAATDRALDPTPIVPSFAPPEPNGDSALMPPATPTPPTPPEVVEPNPVSPPPPPPAPAAAEPRAWTPPPRTESQPSGGALAAISRRKAGILAGLAVAAVLLLIIRRLR